MTARAYVPPEQGFVLVRGARVTPARSLGELGELLAQAYRDGENDAEAFGYTVGRQQRPLRGIEQAEAVRIAAFVIEGERAATS